MELDGFDEERITETEKNILSVINEILDPLPAPEIFRRISHNENLTTRTVKSCLYSLEKKRVVRIIRNASSGNKPLWATGERFHEYYNRNRGMDSSRSSVSGLGGHFGSMNLKEGDFIAFNQQVIRKLSKIDSSELDMLKSLFSEEIDSRRTFSGIRTVQRLLTVLQDRACFTESNVTPLFAIANELKLKSLFDLAKKYEERNGLPICDVCHRETLLLRVKTFEDAEVEGAIIFLSSKLGHSWESLCHSLGMQDDINSYRSQHSCSSREKAYQALMKWKKNTNGASVQHLITALINPQCQMLDLAQILGKGDFYK